MSAFKYIGVRQVATPVADGRVGVELSLYKDKPCGEIALEEFEKYALDRLRVLKAIEESKLRSKGDEVLQAEVKRLLSEYMREPSAAATARKDCVSHHILRLAYCRTADLRAWLLAQECELFKLRFRQLDREGQAEFFQASGLPYAPISDAEFREVSPLLAATAISLGDVDARARLLSAGGARPAVYAVPFAAVPDLVGARKVLLRGGLAYVLDDQVSSLVVGTFRSNLSASLAGAAKRWAAFAASEGGRLAPLVEAMPTRSFAVADPRRQVRGSVSLAQLPALAASGALPPCMAVMYARVAAEHHAKHMARNQLTLFLKAIGLSMDEAVAFWRQMFAPRTSGEKFQKEYAYNVRYQYGAEGSRKDWGEYSCVKIISQEGLTAKNDFCNGGCPFRQSSPDELRALLARMRCSDRLAAEAVDKAAGRHYQLACALAFEGVHGAPCDSGINRPSEWYALSVEAAQQAAERQQAAGAGGTPATPANSRRADGATPAPAGARAPPPTPATGMFGGMRGGGTTPASGAHLSAGRPAGFTTPQSATVRPPGNAH